MEELTFDERVAASVARGREIEAECAKIFKESERVARQIRRENALRDLCIYIGCDLYTVSVGEFARLLNTKKREMGL